MHDIRRQDTETVTFKLNGKVVSGRRDQSILETAQLEGVQVPRLCHMGGMRPDGNCRTCMVEIKGERVLAPSCCRYPAEGMEVTTDNARCLTSQKMSIELLLSDIPETAYTATPKSTTGQRSWRSASRDSSRGTSRRRTCRIRRWRSTWTPVSSAAGCVRACREEQVNDVIGYAYRGGLLQDRVRPRRSNGQLHVRRVRRMRAGLPHGALMPARNVRQGAARQVRRLGCRTAVSAAAHLQHQGQQESCTCRQGRPANSSRLCVKGHRYGFSTTCTPARLTTGRSCARPASPKHKDFTVESRKVAGRVREASWDEALDLACQGPARHPDTYGNARLPFRVLPKARIEEAYLFQKLGARASARTTSITCTRLCHASSVAALMKGSTRARCRNRCATWSTAEVVFVNRANPTVNHPSPRPGSRTR
jgi:formate dehydrogenase major subunit